MFPVAYISMCIPAVMAPPTAETSFAGTLTADNPAGTSKDTAES